VGLFDTPPVQAVPLRVKLVGTGLEPFAEALKPNETLPLVPTDPL